MAEQLKIEGENFCSLADIYNEYISHDGESHKVFMENGEIIKQSQINVYLKSVLKSTKKNDRKDP